MKVILAVDTYDMNTQLHPSVYEELKKWCGNLKTDVQPVYVSRRAIEPQQTLPPAFQEFAPLKMLFSGKSRRQEADILLEYAEEQKASVLVLLSKGNPKHEKGRFGSFAEAIILRSDKPILFLTDSSNRQNPSANKVLFFTDYSESSFQAFSIFLDQMKSTLPEILLFHALTLPSLAVAGSIYAQALNLLPQSYWETEEKKAYAKGERFLEMARMHKYVAKQIVMSKVQSVPDALVKVVKQEGISLIAAMVVNEHPTTHLENPIWICGPRAVGS